MFLDLYSTAKSWTHYLTIIIKKETILDQISPTYSKSCRSGSNIFISTFPQNFHFLSRLPTVSCFFFPHKVKSVLARTLELSSRGEMKSLFVCSKCSILSPLVFRAMFQCETDQTFHTFFLHQENGDSSKNGPNDLT